MNNLNQYRTFVTPAGIGDFAWLYMKLCNLDHNFNVVMSSEANKSREFLSRAVPFLDLLPKVNHGTYSDRDEWRRAPIEEIDENVCWLQANTHLEDGHRIETFLPELPTNLHFEIPTPGIDYQYDILFYSSSLRANMTWHGWMLEEWDELLELVTYNYDNPVAFIGANWDRDYLDLISSLDYYVDILVGLPIGEVIALMKKAKLLVGFPSGIPILSTIVRTPTFMLYPIHLDKMQYTFCEPGYINSEQYKTAIFGSEMAQVKPVFDWMTKWL